MISFSDDLKGGYVGTDVLYSTFEDFHVTFKTSKMGVTEVFWRILFLVFIYFYNYPK